MPVFDFRQLYDTALLSDPCREGESPSSRPSTVATEAHHAGQLCVRVFFLNMQRPGVSVCVCLLV